MGQGGAPPIPSAQGACEHQPVVALDGEASRSPHSGAVRAVGKEREEMKRTTDIFRGRIIDVTEKTYTIELTGNKSKLDAFIDAIDRTAILETVRTGGSGIGRGERILKV